MSDDRAEFLKVSAVRFERAIPTSVERVWRLLADTTLLPDWFGESVIEPRAGGEVRLFGGHVRGVVTQWIPLKYLSHSWNVYGPDDASSPCPESFVAFELESGATDVRLVLTHLPVLERFEKQNAMGWHTFLDMLGAAASGAPTESRAACMTRNAALNGVDPENLSS